MLRLLCYPADHVPFVILSANVATVLKSGRSLCEHSARSIPVFLLFQWPGLILKALHFRRRLYRHKSGEQNRKPPTSSQLECNRLVDSTADRVRIPSPVIS